MLLTTQIACYLFNNFYVWPRCTYLVSIGSNDKLFDSVGNEFWQGKIFFSEAIDGFKGATSRERDR